MAIVLLVGASVLLAVARLARRPAPPAVVSGALRPELEIKAAPSVAPPHVRLGLALGVTGLLWVAGLFVLAEWYFSGPGYSSHPAPPEGFWTRRDLAQFVTGSALALASGPAAWWVGGRRGLLLLSAPAVLCLVLVRQRLAS